MTKTASHSVGNSKPATKNHAPASSVFDKLAQSDKSDKFKDMEHLSVGRELLDTTWRMTVPVVIFAGIGIAIDIALGSKPWVTLLGTVVGFYFAIMLVKRQIARGDSSDGTDTSNNGDKTV
jgi:F0F1-type ATP synthase assembly protein I